MSSCSPFFFFAAALFYLGGRQHSSFSHSRYKILMLFFKRNWSPLFFISVSGSFSVVLANVDIKLSRMKDLASLLLFFISKSPGGYTIYFTPAYMKGWTHVRTYSVRTISSQNQNFSENFLTHGTSLPALRESSAKTLLDGCTLGLTLKQRGRKNYQTHFVLLVSSLFSVSYILRSYWMYQQERWRVGKKKKHWTSDWFYLEFNHFIKALHPSCGYCTKSCRQQMKVR